MWLAVVLALGCGCGRIGFAPSADAAAAGDDAGDASTDTPCWAAWRSGAPGLSPPVRVAALSVTGRDDKDHSFGADELELFFVSDRAGGLGMRDIWHATRADRGSPFVIDGPVDSLSSTADEGVFRLFSDGLRGVVTSRRAGGYDVFLAGRASRTSSGFMFEPAQTDVAAINSANDDQDPLPAEGDLALYFTRTTTTAGTEILLAQRSTPTEPFRDPVPVATLNGSNDDADPMLSPDGRVLVMTSQRADPARDLFVATRATAADAFSAPAPLAGVNTTFAEHDPLISADGCELWFASNRLGDFDIYLSTLTP